MFIQDEISGKVNDFTAVCKAHNVRYIYAFGSSITAKFDRANSDIDLLVDIDYADPVEKGEKLIPYLRKSIDATKILIYDGAKQKVFV
jgi:predicted nucleotidyltransferase